MTSSTAYTARNQQLRAGFASLQGARAFVPPTATTIEAQAEMLKISHVVEDIPNSQGAKLHWLGKKPATKVFLYFHGGGYALGPLDGHITFLHKTLEKAAAGNETVLAFVEYSLSNVARFPTQLIQATEGLRLILSKGYRPCNIIVGGDSAGGNLGLALLSHLLHPYPEAQSLVLSESLRGLLLISPWVSLDTDTQSYRTYGEVDVAPVSLLEEMSIAFLLPKDRNAWSEAYRADASWWENAPVSNVLVTAGETEVFKDHILEVGKKLKLAGVNSRAVVCEGQIHVECILDAQTGLPPRSMSEKIWRWFGEVV